MAPALPDPGVGRASGVSPSSSFWPRWPWRWRRIPCAPGGGAASSWPSRRPASWAASPTGSRSPRSSGTRSACRFPTPRIIPANWELMAAARGQHGGRSRAHQGLRHPRDLALRHRRAARPRRRAHQAGGSRGGGPRGRGLGGRAGHAVGDRRRRALAHAPGPARTPSRRCWPRASRSRASRAGTSGSSRRWRRRWSTRSTAPTSAPPSATLVDEVLAGYRAQMGIYPRILIGLANTFGLIDRDRLVSALHEARQEDRGRSRRSRCAGASPRPSPRCPSVSAATRTWPRASRRPRRSCWRARRWRGSSRTPRWDSARSSWRTSAAAAVRAGELDHRPARPRAADARGRRGAARDRSIAGSRSGSPRRSTATTIASRTSSSAASMRSARRARCGSSRSTRATISSTSASTAPWWAASPAGGLYAIHLLLELL